MSIRGERPPWTQRMAPVEEFWGFGRGGEEVCEGDGKSGEDGRGGEECCVPLWLILFVAEG